MHTLPPHIPEFPYPIAPVQELAAVDEHTLHEHVNQYRPFVLRGYASNWPLTKKLSSANASAAISAVRPLLGDTKIPYTVLPPEQGGDMGIGEDLRANFRVDDRVAPAGEFLQVVADLIGSSTGECAYAASMLLKDFPKIRELLPLTQSVAERDLWNRLLWIGSGRHVVDLHHDQMLNFITLFAGVKRITLLPPQSLPFVYPAPLHRKVGGVPRSLVKLLAVDWQKYPRFQHAVEHAQQTVMHPGDTLFIPPLWWHYVESYGFNLMVNAWYSDVVDQADLTASNHALRDSIAQYHDLVLNKKSTQEHRAILDFDATDAAATATIDGLAASHVSPGTPTLAESLGRARAALAPLPTYWRDWFVLQYEYYVLQAHGDPYPTLPGAMQDVASHFRRQAAVGPGAKWLGLLRRAVRVTLKTLRLRN